MTRKRKKIRTGESGGRPDDDDRCLPGGGPDGDDTPPQYH